MKARIVMHINRNVTVGLLVLALVAAAAEAQTLGLGARYRRERAQNRFLPFQWELDTKSIEAEVGTAPVAIGNVWLEPFLTLGGGRSNSRIAFGDLPPLFDGTGTIAWAGLSLKIDPCDGCGAIGRLDYRHRRIVDHALRGPRLTVNGNELEGRIGYELFDARVTPMVGARFTRAGGALTGFEQTPGISPASPGRIQLDVHHHEPFAGVDVAVGPTLVANVEVGRHDHKYQPFFSLTYRPGAAPPRIPRTPHSTAPLDLTGVSLHDGMLVFDSQATFDRTIEQLASTGRGEELEKRLCHRSLRADVVWRQEQLEAEGRLDQFNDPDNHFVQDEALRTVLNPRGEVQIGNSVYAIWDSHLTVQIPAEKNEVLDRLRNGTPPAVLASAGATLHPSDVSGNQKPQSACKADFTIASVVNSQFTFTNASQGNDPLNFSWDFGDGTPDSPEKNPNHTFAAAGPHKVCLSVYDASGCSATQCRWVQAQACYSHFLFDVADKTVTFTAGATTSGFQLQWSFGDGSTSTEANPKHVYALVGDYDVCLTITSPAGCKDTYCEFVTIKQQNHDCCDANDRVVNKWKTYANDERRFKSVLWQRNFIGYHRWGARTVNYQKNGNGRWQRAKADRIDVTGGGTIYFHSDDGSRCAQPKGTSWSDHETDEARAHFSVAAGSKFWTKSKSLASLHSVRYGGKDITADPLFLSADCTRKECRLECREERGKCKDVCTEGREQCKDVCTEGRNVCSQSCSGGFFKKLFCKISCRFESGQCKRECRKESRSCKRECTKTKRTCVKNCK